MTTTTVTEAAKQVGVSRRTLHRWMCDEAFQRALREARDATAAAVAGAMADLAGTALVTLRDTMTDPDTSPGVKVRAALGVLAQLRGFIEFADETQSIVDRQERPSELDRIIRSMGY